VRRTPDGGDINIKIPSTLEPLILASSSPRRKDILDKLGVDFEIRPARIEETLSPGEGPEANAARLARIKALSVARALEHGTVIGCDTVVAVGDHVMGKPSSKEEARRILSSLSGRKQRVISGLCLVHVPRGVEITGYDVTHVYTKPMSDEDIEAYIATGECFGKAGAYAIQETGDRFIERLEGSFDNVVGFPSELFLAFVKALSLCIEEKKGD
jgi:septum formation protein